MTFNYLLTRLGVRNPLNTHIESGFIGLKGLLTINKEKPF